MKENTPPVAAGCAKIEKGFRVSGFKGLKVSGFVICLSNPETFKPLNPETFLQFEHAVIDTAVYFQLRHNGFERHGENTRDGNCVGKQDAIGFLII